MAKHYARSDGLYLGLLDREPAGAAECAAPPRTADGERVAGMRWDGTAWVSVTAAEAAPVARSGNEPRTVVADAFRDRFTHAELVAVMRAAQTDDDVAVYWVLATTTGSVNLNSATVAAGLDLLTAKGLLAAGRKAEILA